MVKVTTAGSDAFGGNGERGGGSGVGVCATAVGASAHMCDEAACCGERACPALGCEAPPIKENALYLILLGAWFWGCCAAQRRTSLLATGNLRLTERH